MVNHKHKYIYTKIGKSASTSILKMLESVSNRNDYHRRGHFHLADDITNQTKNYFKFSFVRNPWDRTISRYHYIKEKTLKLGKFSNPVRTATFEEFVMEPERFNKPYDWVNRSPNLIRIFKEMSHFENQIDWLTDIDGNFLADYVGKIENLKDDLEEVCSILKIPTPEILHVNKSNHEEYIKYYTNNKMIDAVAKLYERDIKKFNYKFEK
jgi:hypothetical protein